MMSFRADFFVTPRFRSRFIRQVGKRRKMGNFSTAEPSFLPSLSIFPPLVGVPRLLCPSPVNHCTCRCHQRRSARPTPWYHLPLPNMEGPPLRSLAGTKIVVVPAQIRMKIGARVARKVGGGGAQRGVLNGRKLQPSTIIIIS